MMASPAGFLSLPWAWLLGQTIDVPSAVPQPRLRATVQSLTGPRHQANEDAYLMRSSLGVFAVSDGMGGHKGGRTASNLAVEVLDAGLQEHASSLSQRHIIDVVGQANRTIRKRGLNDPDLHGMGCTLAMAWVRGDKLFCFNVGDSRVYRLRDYNLQLLTEDHNTAPKGLGEAFATPVAHRTLTRALGVYPAVEVDVSEWDWIAGDRLLLVTDGVSDVLPDYQLTNLLVDSESDGRTDAEHLVEAAVKGEGRDDKTAMFVEEICDPRPAIAFAAAERN